MDQKTDQVLNNLKAGKQVYDNFAGNFKSRYLIAGKTMEEWEKYFRIQIPTDDPDPATCKHLDIKIMQLYQEAAFFHAEAHAYMQALKKGSDTEYRNRYARLVREYNESGRKLPARGTLEDLVRSETDDMDAALANAELQKDFWKHIMDNLNMCRRLLEQVMWNTHTQVKMDSNHRGNIYEQPGSE